MSTWLALSDAKEHFAARIPVFSQRGLRVIACAPPAAANVRVPGSKSFTNRAAVLAGLCSKPLALEGLLLSDDSWWALDSLERLGFGVKVDPAECRAQIQPPRLSPASPVPLYFGMAGTLARFFPAVVLNWEKTFPALGRLVVNATGAPRLCERPLAELVTSLRSLGAKVAADRMPFALESADLDGQCFVSGKTSGQFLSGLLLAAGGARNAIHIDRIETLVQPDYVRMTIQALEAFGAEVRADDDLREFDVHAPEGLAREDYSIEADASTACYFLAYAVLFDFGLVVENIGSASLQPDLGFASFLRRLGGNVKVEPGRVVVSPRGGAAGALRSSPFKGGFDVDFSACSDQALTAGVLALFADAPIRVHGVEHIRGHESDRIASLVNNLRGLGVEAEEFPDGFKINPPTAGTALAGLWETHGDHRFAMSGFLAATRHPGIEILQPGCVEKTAPDFFARMEALGARFG